MSATPSQREPPGRASAGGTWHPPRGRGQCSPGGPAAVLRPTSRSRHVDPDGGARPMPRPCYDRAAMPDRFYITTAIAYANNKPGLHTLHEVIAADALARWHRMRGIPTRFLTGTDEHSVNIAQRAAEEGRSPRDFVDEKVALFRAAEDALLISPDRFIRTSDPDHVRSAQEMVRRAYARDDIYVGTYEGWYCPNEGFRNATDVTETAAGTICPNHPDVPLQWLTEKNWFFRLSAYQERLERWFEENPGFVQPDYRRNEMLGFIRGGLEDFSISRAGAGWGIPFPLLPDGSDAHLPDALLGPRGRHDLRLVRRPHQLHHRRRLPRRPGALRALVAGRPPRHRQGHRPLPHDLLAGDALVGGPRSPAEGLGPRLAARPGRADEQEPRQLPRPARLRRCLRRGRRALRRPARGGLRPRQRRLVGRLPAPLQRRPRQRLREPGQPDGVHGRPLPRRRAPGAAAGPRRTPRRGLGRHPPARRREARRLPGQRGAGRALGVRGRRQQDRRRRGAVGAGEGGEGGRRGRGQRACATSWATSWRPAAWSRSRPRR